MQGGPVWEIKTTDVFDNWFSSLNDAERAAVLAALMVLREKGPGLSRPYADTVKGSCYCNMKELRIQSRGEPLRAFFAFDPYRVGMVLCAGNKAGNEKRFYDRMLQIADREFTNWLNTLKEKE
nr:type II toxin-antitoxin system RelE/ParE family toxin [Serratia surfactantfaciens]